MKSLARRMSASMLIPVNAFILVSIPSRTSFKFFFISSQTFALMLNFSASLFLFFSSVKAFSLDAISVSILANSNSVFLIKVSTPSVYLTKSPKAEFSLSIRYSTSYDCLYSLFNFVRISVICLRKFPFNSNIYPPSSSGIIRLYQ